MSGRRIVIVAALAAAVVLAFVAAQSLAGGTVYYLTPAEARDRGIAPGATARLGGQVERGSLVYDPRAGASGSLTFVITDGIVRVRVIGEGAPPGMLREGAGAVVEGAFAGDGTFRARQVIAKHDEVYAPPTPGTTPAHRTAP